jgi:hypothetical protein
MAGCGGLRRPDRPTRSISLPTSVTSTWSIVGAAAAAAALRIPQRACVSAACRAVPPPDDLPAFSPQWLLRCRPLTFAKALPRRRPTHRCDACHPRSQRTRR